MAWDCHVCGERHDDLPDVGADYPDYYLAIPEAERDARAVVTPDTCIVDREHYFVRGTIAIPVHDFARSFGLGVWVSQKRENFETHVADPAAPAGPFFGWLMTEIPCYAPTTTALKTSVSYPGGSARPAVTLEPTDHPLAVEQRDGITLGRAWEIVHALAD